MSAKHTPGPWRAVESGDGGEVVDANGYEVAELNTGGIAINRDWLDSHDEHWSGHGPESYIEREPDEIDANARLMAAAPDLLAELKQEVECLERWANRADRMAQESIDGGWSTHHVAALRAQADEYRRRASGLRAAIAKATEATP